MAGPARPVRRRQPSRGPEWLVPCGWPGTPPLASEERLTAGWQGARVPGAGRGATWTPGRRAGNTPAQCASTWIAQRAAAREPSHGGLRLRLLGQKGRRWPLREARRGPCGSGDHPRPASLWGGTRPRTWQAQDGPTAFATSGQTCRAAAPPPLLGLLVEPAKDSGSTEGPVRAAEGRGSGRERGPRSGPEGTARSEQLHGSRGTGEAVPCPPPLRPALARPAVTGRRLSARGRRPLTSRRAAHVPRNSVSPRAADVLSCTHLHGPRPSQKRGQC